MWGCSLYVSRSNFEAPLGSHRGSPAKIIQDHLGCSSGIIPPILSPF